MKKDEQNLPTGTLRDKCISGRGQTGTHLRKKKGVLKQGVVAQKKSKGCSDRFSVLGGEHLKSEGGNWGGAIWSTLHGERKLYPWGSKKISTRENFVLDLGWN